MVKADFSVDVVITYVDMSDPVWQKEFNDTKAKLLKIGQLPQYQNSYGTDRFQSNDLLELALFSVKNFMPWVRKTFLVVSNPEQVPEYAKEYGVQVVLHNQIIPEEYLPTFNSCTIEMFLHKISGLAEHFIYLNDDSFVLHNVSKSAFFELDGLPINNYHFKQLKKDRNSLGVLYPIYKKSFQLAMRAAGATFYRNRKTALVPCHHPKPMLKSVCKKLWRGIPDQIRESLTPFRSEKSVSNYMFCDYMLLVGKTHDREIRSALTLNAENFFGQDFISINDVNQTVNIGQLKKLLWPEQCDEIHDMFRYALSISCNKKRRFLQNAAFMYTGLPQPMTFRAMTSECMLDPESYGPLLAEMQKEYSFNVRTLWKDVGVKTVKKCCTLSHLLAVYFAKTDRWPYVIVFEDDAWPAVDAVEMCRFAFDAARQSGEKGQAVNFIRFGYNGCIDDDNPGEKLRMAEYRGMAGAHAYMVFKDFYDEYIKQTLQKYEVADYIISNETPGAAMLNKSAFIQFNSILYTDKNLTKNISSSLKNKTVYIRNHVYGADCPAGYVDFEDVQKYIEKTDASLAQASGRI